MSTKLDIATTTEYDAGRAEAGDIIDYDGIQAAWREYRQYRIGGASEMFWQGFRDRIEHETWAANLHRSAGGMTVTVEP